MIAGLVYALCALTSWTCAVLQLRAYFKRHVRLLLWSGAAFCAFGLSNVILFIDLFLVPEVDLLLLRNCVTLTGVLLLLWGLIWEASS